ncbi:hypothetical protein BDN70DRAFT_155031 [Pholiota conissans]|uniref:Uncharacterized protein n=1 Tax=Pholiota conissans TaxID=109636 RepID=A0A9P6CXK6_9AGAR|nr:hypothetical protein BDN70DRAFT_155031 [Pholiota conissans]
MLNQPRSTRATLALAPPIAEAATVLPPPPTQARARAQVLRRRPQMLPLWPQGLQELPPPALASLVLVQGVPPLRVEPLPLVSLSRLNLGRLPRLVHLLLALLPRARPVPNPCSLEADLGLLDLLLSLELCSSDTLYRFWTDYLRVSLFFSTLLT